MKARTTAAFAVLFAAVAMLTSGCAVTGENDEDAIRSLLNGSSYTDASQEQAYGAEDSTVKNGSEGPGSDSPGRVPFVRFRRYVPPGGVSRQITIDIPAYPGYPDTTALATITSEINGELRTLYDTTGNPMLVWRKQFRDQAVRTAYLVKTQDGWRLRKVSPLQFSTLDAAYDLDIAELKIHAASWAAGDTFRLTSPDTMLAKHELPAFEPEDEVTVWITVESTGDSCWTFLHHGRPKWPHRWRRAYLKTSTHQFQETWHIGDEGYEKPQVRPSGHDAIGWNSLWADSSQPYVSAAWGLPYIVVAPGEEIPEE